MFLFHPTKTAALRRPSPPEDIYLARWSGLLHILVGLAALFTFIAPYQYFTQIGRLALLHEGKIYAFHLWDLPPLEQSVVLVSRLSPKVFWLYVLYQFFALARNFRLGRIFEESNGRRFVRAGYALAIVSVLDTLVMPAIALAFYWGGTTPWMADLPLAQMIAPDLAMGGLFFIIIGKVMRRAAEMEEESRLIV